MKISSHQVRAVLLEYAKKRAARANPSDEAEQNATATLLPNLRQRLQQLPEQRDLVVHDLRVRMRRGRYYVSSGQIVDALLGRLAADLLKE